MATLQRSNDRRNEGESSVVDDMAADSVEGREQLRACLPAPFPHATSLPRLAMDDDEAFLYGDDEEESTTTLQPTGGSSLSLAFSPPIHQVPSLTRSSLATEASPAVNGSA